MVILNDEKVKYLQDIVGDYYAFDNEADRADTANQIIGILDYVLSTDNQPGYISTDSFKVGFPPSQIQYVPTSSENSVTGT